MFINRIFTDLDSKGDRTLFFLKIDILHPKSHEMPFFRFSPNLHDCFFGFQKESQFSISCMFSPKNANLGDFVLFFLGLKIDFFDNFRFFFEKFRKKSQKPNKKKSPRSSPCFYVKRCVKNKILFKFAILKEEMQNFDGSNFENLSIFVNFSIFEKSWGNVSPFIPTPKTCILGVILQFSPIFRKF